VSVSRAGETPLLFPLQASHGFQHIDGDVTRAGTSVSIIQGGSEENY
jgi:hypothetical protein